MGDPPIAGGDDFEELQMLRRRIHLRQLITAACIGFRYDLDPITTHGVAFDRVRGLKPQLRQVVNWIAVHSGWITRHANDVWRANPRGAGWTKEGVRHDVVIELARLGFVELLEASGYRLTVGGWPGHAKLLQVA
jgi:hypothetical protein